MKLTKNTLAWVIGIGVVLAFAIPTVLNNNKEEAPVADSTAVDSSADTIAVVIVDSVVVDTIK